MGLSIADWYVCGVVFFLDNLVFLFVISSYRFSEVHSKFCRTPVSMFNRHLMAFNAVLLIFFRTSQDTPTRKRRASKL